MIPTYSRSFPSSANWSKAGLYQNPRPITAKMMKLYPYLSVFSNGDVWHYFWLTRKKTPYDKYDWNFVWNSNMYVYFQVYGSDRECITMATQMVNREGAIAAACSCPPECEETEYNTGVSASTWPGTQFWSEIALFSGVTYHGEQIRPGYLFRIESSENRTEEEKEMLAEVKDFARRNFLKVSPFVLEQESTHDFFLPLIKNTHNKLSSGQCLLGEQASYHHPGVSQGLWHGPPQQPWRCLLALPGSLNHSSLWGHGTRI